MVIDLPFDRVISGITSYIQDGKEAIEIIGFTFLGKRYRPSGNFLWDSCRILTSNIFTRQIFPQCDPVISILQEISFIALDNRFNIDYFLYFLIADSPGIYLFPALKSSQICSDLSRINGMRNDLSNSV